MSINANRETKRLNDTITKIAAAELHVKNARNAIAQLNKPLEAITEQRLELAKKIDAMNHAKRLAQAHIDAWRGQEVDLGYPKDELEMDAEQIKAADESLARYLAEFSELDAQLSTESNKTWNARKLAQEELSKADNELSMLLFTKAQQEEALKRQEAAYPARLKRHLLKCKKYGWADTRLGGGKK